MSEPTNERLDAVAAWIRETSDAHIYDALVRVTIWPATPRTSKRFPRQIYEAVKIHRARITDGASLRGVPSLGRASLLALVEATDLADRRGWRTHTDEWSRWSSHRWLRWSSHR